MSQNEHEGLKWFEKTADSGFVPVMVYLANLFCQCQIVPQDYIEAIH